MVELVARLQHPGIAPVHAVGSRGGGPHLAVQPAGRAQQPRVRPLAGLPAAAPAPVGDDVMGKISLLEGEDLEKFMAKMPTADVDKLLRAAA